MRIRKLETKIKILKILENLKIRNKKSKSVNQDREKNFGETYVQISDKKP